MRSMVELAMGKGTVVAQVANATEALAAVDRHQVDTAIVEIQMPLGEGLTVIAALRAAHPSMMIVVCTFDGGRLIQKQAAEAGSDSYLVKPVSARELRDVLGAERRPPLVTANAQ
jgi:DNA-binding response OmpR family regulator